MHPAKTCRMHSFLQREGFFSLLLFMKTQGKEEFD